MAHYTINHTCGHAEEVQLFGKLEDRYRKIEWLETLPCKACRAKAEVEAASKIEDELKPQPITIGSEKQIAWARSIRAQFLTSVKEINFDATKVVALMDTKAELSKAEWWIDRKDQTGTDYVKYMLRTIMSL